MLSAVSAGARRQVLEEERRKVLLKRRRRKRAAKKSAKKTEYDDELMLMLGLMRSFFFKLKNSLTKLGTLMMSALKIVKIQNLMRL